MKPVVAENPAGRRKLDPKLVVGTVVFGLLQDPTQLLADDAQELAAIKAQMRFLAARVAVIESHQARKKAQAQSGAGRVAAGGRVVTRQRRLQSANISDAPADPSIRFPSDTVPDNAATAPALWRAGLTPVALPALSVADAAHVGMDLSSSSPAAITQTSVDHLPPVFSIGGISVRLGGFVELSNIWRDSNLSAGPATAWNNFPYANSVEHGLSEERLSAQLSRMSILMEANPSPVVRLQAYVESDFGGAAGTSNSVQISGYTPRMRQAYFTFTQKDWGFHLLMGQAWSLVTNYAKGILPRHEQLPAVTDNNQIPGIAFTRVPQIRLGKDWHEKYWLGLSVEDAQATVAFSSPLSSGGTLPAAYGQAGGATVYYQDSGGVLLNSTTHYTYNPAPDVVLKAAVDTNYGHYEVFGLARWFRSLSVPPGGKTTQQHTSFGGGVGAGVTAPLGTDKLQLAGNILAGRGVGRYGPSLLPDTTLGSRGQLVPVPEIIGSLGLIGHPTSSLLLYTYGGVETAGRERYIGADGRQYGYGVTDLNLGGCAVEFGTCNAQTRTLASFTAGGWWHVMQGHYGSLMGGLQYTYIRKFAFRGNDGRQNSVYPATAGNTVYVTFRYFPFQ